jgi:hypothetical protein
MASENADAIIPTADYMAYFRGLSDIPYAQEISQIIGAEKTARQVLGDAFSEMSFIAVAAEVRHKKINFYIEQSPYINILEFAVGRSPRGLQLTANPAITYVATDLAASLQTYTEIMHTLMRRHALKRTNLITTPVDIFNATQIQEAVSLLPPGPILFVFEGLLSYYSHEQKSIFLKHLLRVLKKIGGAIIAADFSYRANDSINANAAAALLRVTGRSIIDNSFLSFEEVPVFLGKIGFSAKRLAIRVPSVSQSQSDIENQYSAKRIAELPVWILEPAL